MPSAGDAAQAIAITASGSIEKLVEEMNARAQEIGLSETSFSNAVGFDDDNFSSAEDIAKLLETALKNPDFKAIFERFEFYSASLNKTLKKTFENNDVITGGKTGFTYLAGRCLASTAKINGANLLVVDLNEDWQTDDYIKNSLKIYNFYQENYGLVNILTEGDEIIDIKVEDSETKNLKIFTDETVTKFLKNNTETYSSFDGVEKIDDEFSVGDFLGTYTIRSEAETLYQKELFLTEEIEFYPYWLWNAAVGGLVVFVAMIICRFKLKKHKQRN